MQYIYTSYIMLIFTSKRKKMNIKKQKILLFILLMAGISICAQQDPQPRTQTLTIDSPVAKNVGLGLSIVNDQIGPTDEFYADLNFSYTIKATENYKLSFGAKGGARIFNIDWTKGQSQNPDILFQQNIQNQFFPTIGAGLYLYSEHSYFGASIPNFFSDQHYDDIQQSIASEELHFFFIGGFILEPSNTIKLKPAFLVKHVVNDRFRIGVSYRWDDSFSGMAGFQISPELIIGYSYDYTTTELQRFTTGSHELMVRFDLRSKEQKLKSPRFF